MAQKKTVIGALAFLLVLLLVMGALALAAEVGGKDDPLVGLSYLQGLEPQLKESIDKMTAEKMDEYSRQIENRLAEARQQLDALAANGGAGGGVVSAELTEEQLQAIVNEVISSLPAVSAAPGGTVPATYVRVEIPAGKTVKLGMGSSFYLRTGTATVFKDSSPGLINLTTGETQDDGAIKPNHLYSVTFDFTKGFKASAASIAFILGPYQIV